MYETSKWGGYKHGVFYVPKTIITVALVLKGRVVGEMDSLFENKIERRRN